MNFYFTKCDELNLLLCIQNGLWGQQRKTMKAWKPGDKLILQIEEGIAGLFQITSNQFEDNSKVWPDKPYPYRVNINPIKILNPKDRISIAEYDIKKEFKEKHGPGWGTIIILALKPVDNELGNRIQKLIEQQPDYDPFPTLEKDIKNLAGSIEQPKIKKPTKKIIEIKPPPKTDEKSLHDSLIDMIEKIGKYENKYSETEYNIGNLGRLDVVWKRIKTGNPSYAFEVQIKGNFYQALAKLKHAFDLWNSVPVLITTKQFETQAEELLSGSFHEIKHHAKIIHYEKIREWYSIEVARYKLKKEIDLL